MLRSRLVGNRFTGGWFRCRLRSGLRLGFRFFRHDLKLHGAARQTGQVFADVVRQLAFEAPTGDRLQLNQAGSHDLLGHRDSAVSTSDADHY
jgi:hypothetical protein